MRKFNRIAKLCLAAAITVLLIAVMCLNAFAAAPDLQRKGSITFTMAYNSIPVPGGTLSLYRIATVMELAGDLHYNWVPELEDSGLLLSKRNTEVFADRISMLIDSRSLPSVTRTISGHGKVTFSDLPCGLYVIYQRTPAAGFEPINAFCISIPMLEDNEFVYDISGSPKPRPETTTTEITVTRVTVTTPGSESTTSPEEPTTASHEEDERLPQTGQLWWPAWLTGAIGLMMFGVGLSLRITTRQEDYWS